MSVGFCGADFEGGGDGRGEEIGFVEATLGTLGQQGSGRIGEGRGEGGRGIGGGCRAAGRHCCGVR